MTMPTRAAKPRRGRRRPGWALLTALLVLAIGSGIALVFTDKAIYLRIGLVLALWATVLASFAALSYRRQSDTDQAKVHDQKLVYDLQLEREISARREYELTVESRLRQQLAGEIEAQAADEIATLRAELAALRTNLEILFNTDLSDRPAIEHDPIRALGPWPGAQPQTVPTTSSPAFTHSVREPQRATGDEYQDVTAVDEDNRTSEYPIIDVAAEPLHLDRDEVAPTAPYPMPPFFGAAQPHEPEPYQQPTSSGTHWRPQPEPHVTPGYEPQFPAAAEREPQPYWSPSQENWDIAPDGEDWDPMPAPMAAPEEPVWNPPAPEWDVAPAFSPWEPVPVEGQWSPPGTDGSMWAPDEHVVPPGPYQDESAVAGRHSGIPSWQDVPAASGDHELHGAPENHAAPEDTGGGHWAAQPPDYLDNPGGYQVPEPEPQEKHGKRRAQEPQESEETRGRRHAEDTGGFSVADLLGRIQNDSSASGGRRRRRED